ncbi:hypothetical protein ABZ926_24685 [Streptomyces litmocidini]|uniref:Uncharacterized protein n=1 Tax=Streptomyces litmocidini TaxID=67318 RepID=A0ABW7U578_9ACTN
MRHVTTSFGHGPAYPAQPGVSGSHFPGVPDFPGMRESHVEDPDPAFEDPDPAPVFVDQSGLRSRLFRRFGWPVSVVGAILAAAMGSSLVGMQSDAPAMGIPPKPSYLPTTGPLSPSWP